MAMVPFTLARIVLADTQPAQKIILKELGGERHFTIEIGGPEAVAIYRRAMKRFHARPLTHDLLVNSIEELGGELDSVVINDLREHTYFAKLRVKVEGELIEIDSRPSDAIAVAVTCDPTLPIYVEEHVLEEAIRP